MFGVIGGVVGEIGRVFGVIGWVVGVIERVVGVTMRCHAGGVPGGRTVGQRRPTAALYM